MTKTHRIISLFIAFIILFGTFGNLAFARDTTLLPGGRNDVELKEVADGTINEGTTKTTPKNNTSSSSGTTSNSSSTGNSGTTGNKGSNSNSGSTGNSGTTGNSSSNSNSDTTGTLQVGKNGVTTNGSDVRTNEKSDTVRHSDETYTTDSKDYEGAKGVGDTWSMETGVDHLVDQQGNSADDFTFHLQKCEDIDREGIVDKMEQGGGFLGGFLDSVAEKFGYDTNFEEGLANAFKNSYENADNVLSSPWIEKTGDYYVDFHNSNGTAVGDTSHLEPGLYVQDSVWVNGEEKKLPPDEWVYVEVGEDGTMRTTNKSSNTTPKTSQNTTPKTSQNTTPKTSQNTTPKTTQTTTPKTTQTTTPTTTQTTAPTTTQTTTPTTTQTTTPKPTPTTTPTFRSKPEAYSRPEISTSNYSHMTPDLKGNISSEIYNVEEAIPTSEDLNYTITADEALYDIVVRKTRLVAGVKNVSIALEADYTEEQTYTYINESGDKVEDTYLVTRSLYKKVTDDFEYETSKTIYDVPVSNIYPIKQGVLTATLNENVLNSGAILFAKGSSVKAQTLSFTCEDPVVSNIEYGYAGNYDSYEEAINALNNNVGLSSVENRIKAKVEKCIGFTGRVNYTYGGLNVTTSGTNGVTPVVGSKTGTNTNMIPSTYPNGTYVGGGSVTYEGGFTFGVTPNNVVIHTPVVNKAKINYIKEFVNQKINQDPNVTYLILDGEFELEIPDNGTHNNYKGYGTRTYNSNQGVTKLPTTWGKIKDVKFPFDVYIHGSDNTKYFMAKNTWLSDWKNQTGNNVSLNSSKLRFTVPVWVDEKTYEIETRVISENAVTPDMYEKTEENFNSSLNNYVATKKIPVEIIGKIYDLRISASNDPGWAQIYSQKTRNDYIKADEFPFGQQGQNRVTQYKYAPKLGYTFVFNFKTKGRKSNNIDVSIQPEGFYFVSKDGKKTQEVDLYYDTTTTKNVKILPADTNVNLSVTLRDAMYKVPAIEFTDSVRIYNAKYNYASAVRVGTFAKMNLPENLRLCYNNFAEYVNKLYGKGASENSISQDAGARDTVIGSVGHWYAGYRLPASTKAVPKGTDIQTAVKNNSFLNDGYILVKFNLNSYYNNGTGNYPYLHYMGPEGLNEKGEETGKLVEKWPGVGPGDNSAGFKRTTLPNGNTAEVPVGSVAIFEANLRSSNDVEVAGTH